MSDTEARVYISLLPLGTVPASAVATRLKIPRPTAKYNCEQLQRKGLIAGVLKNNSFYYTAKEPNVLYSLLSAEKKEIEKKESNLGQMMGDLKQLFNTQTKIPKIQYFEGAEAITKMLDDVLKDQNPIYGALTFTEDMSPVVSEYVHNVYIPKRKLSKIPAWMLFNDNEKTQNYKNDDLEMNRISLLVPEKDFPFDICFHIYGNKIAFYSYNNTDLVGVIIEDIYIRKMQFSLFKLAWNAARVLEVNKNYRNVEIET